MLGINIAWKTTMLPSLACDVSSKSDGTAQAHPRRSAPVLRSTPSRERPHGPVRRAWCSVEVAFAAADMTRASTDRLVVGEPAREARRVLQHTEYPGRQACCPPSD